MTWTSKERRIFTLLIAALLFIIILMGLSSCSDKATRQLRRAKKLEEKAIANGAKVTADTVFIDKPVYIPEVKTDTIFQSEEGDTVIIEKDRLKIKYVNMPADSVYIEGECKADTIIQRVRFAVTKKISSGHTTWDMVILAIFCLPVGWLLISFVVIPLARRGRS